MQVPKIQALLAERNIDGWLFADFRRSNPIAYQALGLQAQIVTRRWYYFVPRAGEPQKLVSALEAGVLDGLPGEKQIYRTWQERERAIEQMLAGATTIAMEYSPRNAIPYISCVDAGTVEFVRSLRAAGGSGGKQIVSSADLVQYAVAQWSPEQHDSHIRASTLLMQAKEHAYRFIGNELRAGRAPTDYDVQQLMRHDYAQSGLVADDPPIVATNAHASDPHYLPTAETATPIRTGDLVLIDFWAKLDHAGAVYADHTWMAFAGRAVPEKPAEIFGRVAAARDAAIELVRRSMATGTPLHGYEVDDVARKVIVDAGYGDYFIHRTGHSIGEEVHGDGANMDDFETRDERLVLPRTCFSIEPGIYLPEYGFRSEINIYVHDDGGLSVTGGPEQQAIVALL